MGPRRAVVHFLLLAVLVAACAAEQTTPSAIPPGPTSTLPTQATPDVTENPQPRPTASLALPAWIADQQLAMTDEARSDVPTLEHLSRHDIDLSIGIESLTLTARQTTLFTNNAPEPLEELRFNLFPNSSRFGASMEIERVTIDGAEWPFEYLGNRRVVKVPLPEPLPPGETISVTLDFSARVPHVQKNYYLVFVLAQGVLSLGDWHPMLAVYDEEGWHTEYPEGTVGEIVFSESAFYAVRLTLPQGLGLDVMATGVEVARVQNPDGTETRVFYSGPVRDFHLVVSDRYEVATGKAGDTRINSCYWPEHEVCGREALGFAQQAMTLYNELFGAYPFSELDLAEADLWPWAIEWPGLILVGEPLYSDPAEDCGEWHVVHEVAHQWWYSVVGNDQVDDPWLDEALANYSTVLYYEITQDTQTAAAAIEEHIDQRYQAYVQSYGDGIVGGPTKDYTRSSYYPLVYAKGALFFGALRGEMGEEAFFRGLRTYYGDFKYRVATPEDLLHTMEQAHGQHLDGFFQRWVFSAEDL